MLSITSEMMHFDSNVKLIIVHMVKQSVDRISVCEMRMFGVLRVKVEKIRNENIRDNLEVVPIEENRLRWVGHACRRPK